MCITFFFNDTATTEIYTLSLHDALPIWPAPDARKSRTLHGRCQQSAEASTRPSAATPQARPRRPSSLHERLSESWRSEEHTSELQSRQYLVCRLLLEKKKKSSILLSFSH